MSGRKIFLFLVLFLGISFPNAFLAQKVNDKLLVSTAWLSKNLDKTVILHVGINRQSYDAGHIPGARFVAWSEITTTRNEIPNELPSAEHLQALFTRLGVGNAKKIVLYGDLQGLAAARAFFTLDYLGHGNRIAILNGGLEKWKAENRPLSTEIVMPKPENFTVKINPQIVISLDVVRDVSWSVINQISSNFSLIDARPPEEYSGEKPGDGIIRPGHIPGAYNIFWQENIASRENPVIKPVEELRKIYEQAGVAADKVNVVYCRTGGQASHAYFTLRYLGYNVRLYEGSYFEWNKQNDTPVVKGKQRF